MKEWQNSNNIVLLYYAGYAGGKFISCNLSFNDNCCPAIFIDCNKTAEENLATKIQAIQNTVPPTKQKCTDWSAYEIKCDEFWKFATHEVIDDPTALDLFPKQGQEILESKYCFMMVHHENVLVHLKTLFPNARVIQLYDYMKFINIAAPLKGCTDNLANCQPDLIPHDFLFHMDPNIFDWALFQKEIARCLQWLGLTYTYTKEQEIYYKRYMHLHS